MAEFNLDLDRVLRDAQREALKIAEEKVQRIVRDTIAVQFRDGSYWQEQPGIAYQMVKNAAEEYILSDEFATKISTAVRAAADNAVTHSAEIVMKKVARKLAFAALNSETE